MAYTNNVPQGNQQIATTQPLIQANFGFLGTGIAQEHNFNSAGTGNDMYHLKASMPDLGVAPTLPAGTTGMYYVEGGEGRYWNGTAISQLTLGASTANGYQWIGKVLLQWGIVNSNNATGTTPFNIAFPTACFAVQLTSVANNTTSHANGMYVQGTPSVSQFVWNQADRATQQIGFYWMAIGN